MNQLTGKEIAKETPRSASAVDGTFDKATSIEDTTMKQEQTLLPYLFGNKEDYLNLVVPLYEASIVGDWETAKIILDKHPYLVRFGLSKNLGTALHVAATAEETRSTLNFVKNLVDMMTMEELELRNTYSNTAFFIACLGGKMKTAMIMMEKNRRLLDIRGASELLPLSISSITGTSSLVKCLYNSSQKMTGDHWTDSDRHLILSHCVERGFFDIALQIVMDHPELVENVFVLEVLSRKTKALNGVEKNLITRIIESTFRLFHIKVQSDAKVDTDALNLLKVIWGRATRKMSIDEIEDKLRRPPPFDDNMQDSFRILHAAAEMGNTRFIVELLRTYPDLMVYTNDNGHTIFHIAVMNRHQGIYNLLYEIGSSNNDICILTDESENNMLHLVGKSSKAMASKTTDASLLMQRELLWFKEVEKMMLPHMREARNNAGETPYELFSKENEDLVSKGLKWMKDSMVVATLIVTVAFAVAFTVPGGYNQEHGFPVFIHEPVFLVFVIADAVSLTSSSTSLLVFLSVLTSHHDQREFMYSLPRKLMMGLLALFISVAAMMVTFSASFFVLYHNNLKWVPILIAAFAVIPVIVFAILQFPLLVDMFRSTYDPHYLFNPKKRVLYTIKRSSHSNNSSCWWFRSV